jgi:glutamate N-acetyltransferase/amino-acid N-acetyltransferase
MGKVSPLAPASFPLLPPIAGIRLMTAAAGIRYQGRDDVLVMVLDEGTAAAGVLTQSKCPSAPVEWCRSVLPKGTARAVLVNSGNANAFTGRRGREAAQLSAEAVAQALGCEAEDILLASTGVIGEPLAAERFAAVVGDMVRDARPELWESAAKAIMTTDTYAKGATATAKIDDVEVRINGIAKGSGMIAPDMATMLAFVATDAPIAAPALQEILSAATRNSFNAITVDGDTSTSDTVLFLATGAAQLPPVAAASDPRLSAFKEAVDQVVLDLAHQVVRDGEGATKFVEIEITGAVSDASARRIAMSVANSPLVKTAVAGEDANWGRVVMAVGKAGEPADRDLLTIWFGPHRVATEGERDSGYSEEEVSAYMQNQELAIRVDIGLGDGRDRVWTCDLTHGYIDINADYRT